MSDNFWWKFSISNFNSTCAAGYGINEAVYGTHLKSHMYALLWINLDKNCNNWKRCLVSLQCRIKKKFHGLGSHTMS
jgi:hypothetical protein